MPTTARTTRKNGRTPKPAETHSPFIESASLLARLEPTLAQPHPTDPQQLPMRPETWEGFGNRGVRVNVSAPYEYEHATADITLERPIDDDRLILKIRIDHHSEEWADVDEYLECAPATVLLLAEAFRRLVVQARAEGLIPYVADAFPPKSSGEAAS